MTEGTPASSSIMLLMKVGTLPWVKYSPKKMEMGREKKTEMNKSQERDDQRANDERERPKFTLYRVPR